MCRWDAGMKNPMEKEGESNNKRKNNFALIMVGMFSPFKISMLKS